MKKRLSIVFGLLAAGMLMFTSCSDDSSEPGDINPSMNFVGGTGYTSADVTLTTGTAFTVGINASSSTESNAKLTNFKITRVFNNKPEVVLDSTFNKDQFSIDWDFNANPEVGTENFIFLITDKDGKTKQLNFVVTTQAAAGPINAFSMKILGAQGSTTGSSFASIDGSVYSLADAKANAAKIDWLYFNVTSIHATLAAPDDAAAATVFTNDLNGLQEWAVKNPTRFKKVTDAIDWDNINDDAVIVAQTASGVTLTKVDNLAASDVLAFVTATGKKGLIKVNSISGTSAGTITISVKVQQ